MADQQALSDDNGVKSLIVESSTTPNETVRVKGDPNTGAFLSAPSAGGGASTATNTNVSAAASDTELRPANANRRLVVITNDSTDTLYIKFGTGASATSFTRKMKPDETVRIYGAYYTGVINGLWSGTNGAARITEV